MQEDLGNYSSEDLAEAESIELYRYLIENSSDAISVHRGGRFHYINTAGAKLFSASNPEEMVGKLITDFAHPDYRRAIEELLNEVEEGDKKDHQLEAKFLRPDGGVIDAEVSFSQLALRDGPAVHVVIRNIGEQKRAAEIIRASEDYYRDLVEHSRDLMCTHDLQGRLLSVNEAAVRISGYEAGFFLNKNIREFLAPEFQSQFDDYLLRMKSDGYAEGLMHVQTRTGERRIWQYYNTLRSDGVSPPVVRGMAHDITDLKRAEQKILKLNKELEQRVADAEAANRAKDEFLATVSHELRAPLASILMWAHILRNRKTGDAGVARGLDAIERSSKAQAKLVEDIMDVSRIVSGKLRLNTRPTNLLSVITAAIDVVRPAAKAKGVDLRLGADACIGEIEADPDRLQQVVWNLLSNAVKFTDTGGSVEVKLECTDQNAQVTVRDTGAGITPEFLPHVFERFRQADGSFTRRHGGLGLGLAIVRHLVEMHGGTVEVESAGEGSGACFRVRLPLKQSRGLDNLQQSEAARTLAYSTQYSTPNSRQSIVEGLRVVIVDDDADNREAVLVMLEQHGAKVLACSSAAEAIELLQRYRPDILVSDIAMPDEDGYSLINKVRALSTDLGGRVPAVALTAHVRAEDRSRALSAGYQAFLSKPVEVDELLMSIATLAMSSEGRSS